MRHFWTPVNTACVNTCDALVTNMAREHGCQCSRAVITAREHGWVVCAELSLTSGCCTIAWNDWQLLRLQNRSRQLRRRRSVALGERRDRLPVARQEMVVSSRALACQGQRWRTARTRTLPAGRVHGRIQAMWVAEMNLWTDLLMTSYSCRKQ